MGEVHDAQEPEDHREAQGEQPERGAEDDAVQELGQEDAGEIVHESPGGGAENLPPGLVLLLDLPGEALDGILADHRLADRCPCPTAPRWAGSCPPFT